jgi:hypothetical protein
MMTKIALNPLKWEKFSIGSLPIKYGAGHSLHSNHEKTTRCPVGIGVSYLISGVTVTSIMEQLTKERFDALMGSTRNPWTRITGVEREWYSEQNEKALGVIVEDTTDNDYACIVLGRDRVGRYRAVHLSPFVETIEVARASVPILLADWSARVLGSTSTCMMVPRW